MEEVLHLISSLDDLTIDIKNAWMNLQHCKKDKLGWPNPSELIYYL